MSYEESVCLAFLFVTRQKQKNIQKKDKRSINQKDHQLDKLFGHIIQL